VSGTAKKRLACHRDRPQLAVAHEFKQGRRRIHHEIEALAD
jgi:hypothetical protein